MRVLVFASIPLLALLAPVGAGAQVPLTSPGSAVNIDFTGWEGAGLSSVPGAGQLDSDAWSLRGLSDGDTIWGLTHATGDHARGTATGGVSTGGAYAFFASSSADAALGFQPTETDVTPGSAVLRLRNDTGAVLQGVEVSFEAWFYNDQDRATAFAFEHSEDDATYTSTWATASTYELAEALPSWVRTPFTVDVEGLSVSPGDYLYLRWSVDDATGTGARDEVAIDDVRVVVTDTGGCTTPGGCAADAGAGGEDAGTGGHDAGPTFDGGVLGDGGEVADAGSGADGGLDDGGQVAGDGALLPPGDSGGGSGGEETGRRGRRGGCSVGAGETGWALPALLGGALLIASRRRRRAPTRLA